MLKSIRQDLSIRIGIVIFCISVVIGVGYYLFSNYQHEEEFKNAIANQTKQLSDTFTLQLWLFDLNTTRELCELFSESPDVSGLRLRDHKKKIVFEKAPPPEKTTIHVNRELLHEGEKRVGYLDIYYADTSREQQRKNTFIMGILMVIGTIAGSFLFINILLKRYLSRPLEALQKDMDLLAKGDFPQSGQLGQKTEIQNIIDTFNKLTISLRERDEEVKRKTDALKTEISERKQAEKMLQESEDRLKIAGKATYDLIYEWDVVNDTLEWFGDIDGLLGYEQGSISREIGAWIELIHPEDKGQLENAVELHRTEAEPIHYEYRIKHRDGSYKHWQDHGRPILDTKGHPAKWIGVCTDITDRRQAEEALRESEWLFSQMFEQSTTSMCLYKPNGTILKINNEFSKMFGVEEKTIIDSGYNVFKDQATIDAGVIPFLKEIFDKKKSRTWTIDFDIAVASDSTGTPTSRPEKIFIEVFGYPVVNRNGQLEFVVLQHYDMTDRRRAEEEKNKLTSQLQHSQKMEAVGTLAGGIAHDFNNILGIILGNAELAMDDMPEWNPGRQNLDEVKKACMRAKDVVRQILNFSRKSEIEQKSTNIESVVVESLKLSRASIPTSIEIRHNIANDVDDILGDPTQIHQVMINLCMNAAHAMENDGGILEVTLENTEIDEDTASHYPELNPGPHVQLGVSDTGDGIKPEVLDRVFDPYFTTKDVGKGTGMGLAVVHGIVKSHHGSIWVKSKLGKGTTFKILFPSIEKKSKGETKIFQKLPTGNEKILFVDDEAPMVNLNQQRLEKLGYKVTGKTDPSEALEFFRANGDQIDLVITDMTMPKMTGDKLAQEILKIRPDIPIILCTGYSERMSEDRAQEIGIRKYIEKPIEMVKLSRSVREVLDEK